MTNKEIADKLEQHNLWRRGVLESMPMNAKELGIVIDEAVRRLRKENGCPAKTDPTKRGEK